MSEDEGPKYKDGDIVWVKLGSCWWPGEVTENGPEDFTSKKPPLAIVKFFNESTYEFVKNHNNIYYYNCDRKNEFIKKGMDSFRANNSHMEKFPGDVSLAEIRTEGNPNILADPMFGPQKKTSNIIAEVFGTPSPKKASKESKHARKSTKNSSKKPKVNITHRRFLGCDDYEAHIRVQYPGKDTENVSGDEEDIVKLNAEPSQTYNCSSCTFKTNRIEVMLFHVQCHIKGIASPVPVKKKSPQKKKKTRVKHITSDDDRTNSSVACLDTDSDEEKPKPKKKRRNPSTSKKNKETKAEEPPVVDIRSNLLAEWSDSDENEENSKHDTSEENITKVIEETEEHKTEDNKDLSKSCFDFDEEEEEENTNLVQTAVGRKIPRVIPHKRKSTDLDSEDASLPLAEEDENRLETLKISENSNSVSNEADAAKEEEVFKDLMDATAVPDLPDVPDAIKPPQNFTSGKTIKIPDKKTDSEVATKLTNPKKRFVKSFEDFELLQNEQRRAQEEEEKKGRVVVEPVEPILAPPEPEKEVPEAQVEHKTAESVDTNLDPKYDDQNLQISKLKCQLMSKLSDEVDQEPEPKIEKCKTSHRTPRSKILESYMNDKQKSPKSKEEKSEPVPVSEEIRKEPASKKSKILKFNQEEKMEIEEEPIVSDIKETEVEKKDVVKEKEENEKESSEEVIEPSEEVMELPKEVAEPTEDIIEPPKEVSESPKELIEPEKKRVKPEKEEKQINEEKILDEKNPDEEIGKINQIDDYLNDFLFDESPKRPEETEKLEEKPNEVRIKSDEGDLDIAIKTNLTNFNKEEEMSALSTLALVSQLEEEKPAEEVKIPFVEKPDTELVPIDGNLTVVSEKDLADGQVEITANASPTCKKPVTLTSFSMDFSDCNSNSESTTSEASEPKPKEEEMKKTPLPDEMFDLEEHIPSQIVDKTKPRVEESQPSKLLERLTEVTPKTKVPKDSTKVTKTKFVIKSPGNKIVKTTPVSKPVILSEKIIKPVTPSGSVSVQKITSKRNLHDPDEIDAFIIQKGAKPEDESTEDQSNETPAKKIKKSTIGMDPKKLQVSSTATSVKKRGKAKILQQTIITPAGEIIQPGVAKTAVPTSDDNVFDINSMPIVLSDQILTPENIESMPIYLSESATEPTTPKVQTIVKKTTPITVQNQMRVLNKSVASPVSKLVKAPKILGSVGSKILKQNSFAPGAKQKFVIVTQPTTATTSKYTVGKKQIVKREMVQNITPEPSGNKIMILTDQQGQQQRLLLTPAQQKMMGYQTQGTKVKTVVKGNIIQKTKDGQMTAVPGSSGLVTKTITPSRLNSNQTLISSSGHVLTPIHQAKSLQKTAASRKIQMQSPKVPQQKTILIKNQHGQTVRKIQGTDDALLDKQVAEQIEAIKASGVLQRKHEVLNYKTPQKNIRRSFVKKVESPKLVVQQKPKTESVVPPLAPISPKKAEVEKQAEGKPERALHQLVIQDAMGNQTTITEGQILALPSETIDGQPQSYMLVTLDESGNLTPLNNEALLSLDPNLGLGGDLGNTVLQIDQNALKETPVTTEPLVTEAPKAEPKEEEKPPEQVADTSVMQTMGETGQQLIVTGDPIAAQKFLESLTEGNTDLANILASAEGSSILIHADGQQILINTDSDNQMLLSVNTDNVNMTESSEGGGNPIFATQPSKNQDILAAALADTDVFQQEQNNSQKVSQLSPNSASLYPMNVSNVLETSLTLNSPIMTPLEVPSTNSKKISDENDILNQVPKNVDLPITITDPNISQTVSQQQVASLMVNELQGNLELSLPISESAITATSSEMHSPSFSYSLPTLDQKPFNSSMPILTEDTEESKEDKPEPVKTDDEKSEPKISPDGSFLDESEGLCTLGGEMCSSLSEPPPDMFDLSAVLSSHQMKTGSSSPKETKDDSVSSESLNPDTASVTETSSPNTINEDSCEIPVQPEIVTTLKEAGSGDELDNDSKKCKFD